MDVARFVEERRPDWERLDRLLRLAGRGLGRLGKVDLRELGALYRQASSDLARAQAAAADPELVEYLTTLVVRGHGIIYRPERARWAGIPMSVKTLVIFFTNSGFRSGCIGHVSIMTVGMVIAPHIPLFSSVLYTMF
jgi:hypothetical protein